VTGPEQHAATVRDAVWKAPGHVHDAALAALDELVALARDNVGLRFLVDAKQALFEGASARAEAAEARADQLQRERDEALRILTTVVKEDGVVVSRLRREADQLRAALEEIEDGTTPDRVGRYNLLRDWVNKTARAALAGPTSSDGQAEPGPGVQAEEQRWPTKADDRGASSPPTAGVQADNKDSA